MDNKGFSLIETIIVIVVLSIGVTGVLSVFTEGMRGAADPLVTLQAVELIQEKVDIIIGDRENTSSGFGFTYLRNGNYPAENPVTGFSLYNRSTNIICVNTANLNSGVAVNADGTCPSGYNYKNVAVTVNWSGNSITANTIVVRY